MEEEKKKIVVGCICERLGNVMCQLAAYMTYAEKYDRKLYVCIIEKNPDKLVQYNGYIPILKNFLFLNQESVNILLKHAAIYKEPLDFKYREIPDFEEDVVFLIGFYQNEKFFDEKLVKKAFAVPASIKKEIKEKYGDLSKATSISVRHGSDYLSQQDHFNVPRGDWYKEAYEVYFPNTKVIVTSDDIAWAKDNVLIKDAIFVDESDKKSVFWDLYVCSLCKNHIIYPGTYGWMGAWLGEKEGSKVVCPDKWWGPKNAHITEQIVPDRWIRFKL